MSSKYSPHRTYATGDEVGPGKTVETVTTVTETRVVSPTRATLPNNTGLVIGQPYTRYTKNTVPLLERNVGNMHVVWSQDPSNLGQNPLADVVGAVANQKAIHNNHIKGVLDRTIDILELERNAPLLDRHGKALAKDLENVFESANRFLVEKNDDEILQRIALSGARTVKPAISQTPALVSKTSGLISGTKIPMDKATKYYNSIKELTFCLIRSGDYRNIASDFVDFFRDLMKERIRMKKGLLSTLEQQPYIPMVNPQATYSTYPQPLERIVRTEYEVKNLDQKPVVERTIVCETYTADRPYESQAFSTTQIPTLATSQEGRPSTHALVERFLSLLARISAKQEYINATKDMFRIINYVGSQFGQAKNASSKLVPLNMQQARSTMQDSNVFLSRFLGEKEMRLFMEHSSSLLVDLRAHEDVRFIIRTFKKFLKMSVEDPDQLQRSETKREAHDLIKSSINLMHQPQYVDRFSEVFRDLKHMMKRLSNDIVTTDISNRLAILAKDIALNSEGYPDIFVMDESFNQLKIILLSLFRNHLVNIPIDRIQVTSPDIDLVLEDIRLSAADILPDNLKFKLKNEVALNLQNPLLGQTVHRLKLKIDHITPIANNVTFFYVKKTGFKISDHGIVSVALLGSGMCIDVDWGLLSAFNEPARVQLSKVKVTIGELVVRFHKSTHRILNALFTKMFLGKVKARLADQIATFLQVQVTKFDTVINQWFQTSLKTRLLNQADYSLRNYLRSAKQTAKDKTAKAKATKKKAQVSFREKIKKQFSPSIEEEMLGIPQARQTAPAFTIPQQSYGTGQTGYSTTTYSPAPASSFSVPQQTYVSGLRASSGITPHPSTLIPSDAKPIRTEERVIREDIQPDGERILKEDYQTSNGKTVRFSEQMMKNAI